VVSAIFLLPVCPEMAVSVSGLFSPVEHVLGLRCVVASRLAQSATGRQATSGILLPVQRKVNVRCRMSPEELSAVQGLSDCRPASSDGSICSFRQTGSVFFARPKVTSPPAQVQRLRSRRLWRSFLFRLRLHEMGSRFPTRRGNFSGKGRPL